MKVEFEGHKLPSPPRPLPITEALLEDYAVLRAENTRLELDLKIATESLRVMDSAADAIILCDACQLCSEHDGLLGE